MFSNPDQTYHGKYIKHKSIAVSSRLVSTADRVDYQNFLENQIERIDSTNAIARASEQRLIEVTSRVSSLEEDSLTVSQLLGLNQKFFEKSFGDISQKINDVENNFLQLNVGKIEESIELFDQSMARIREKLNNHENSVQTQFCRIEKAESDILTSFNQTQDKVFAISEEQKVIGSKIAEIVRECNFEIESRTGELHQEIRTIIPEKLSDYEARLATFDAKISRESNRLDSKLNMSETKASNHLNQLSNSHQQGLSQVRNEVSIGFRSFDKRISKIERIVEDMQDDQKQQLVQLNTLRQLVTEMLHIKIESKTGDGRRSEETVVDVTDDVDVVDNKAVSRNKINSNKKMTKKKQKKRIAMEEDDDGSINSPNEDSKHSPSAASPIQLLSTPPTTTQAIHDSPSSSSSSVLSSQEMVDKIATTASKQVLDHVARDKHVAINNITQLKSVMMSLLNVYETDRSNTTDELKRLGDIMSSQVKAPKTTSSPSRALIESACGPQPSLIELMNILKKKIDGIDGDTDDGNSPLSRSTDRLEAAKSSKLSKSSSSTSMMTSGVLRPWIPNGPTSPNEKKSSLTSQISHFQYSSGGDDDAVSVHSTSSNSSGSNPRPKATQNKKHTRNSSRKSAF